MMFLAGFGFELTTLFCNLSILLTLKLVEWCPAPEILGLLKDINPEEAENLWNLFILGLVFGFFGSECGSNMAWLEWVNWVTFKD